MKPASLCFIALLSAGAAGAQSSNSAFDTADVHAGPPGHAGEGIFISGGRAETSGTTLLYLIAAAYHVETELVAGGPRWLDVDPFFVAAHAAPSTPDETMLAMLQTLLAERFHLAIHREDRPMAIFALRVGKRGLKLKESSSKSGPDCRWRQEGDTITCECQNITMDQFVQRVRDIGLDYTDHAAVNLTSVPGAYDFTLVFTAHGWLRKASDTDAGIFPETTLFAALGPAGGTADKPGGPASSPNGGLTLSAGLERDLGLKLAVQKYPMPVLMIDHVERLPAEN